MKAEHTPIPWELGIDAENNNWSIMGGGIEITHLPFLTGSEDDDVAEANAEFIVRACNCHHKLLEALREIRDAETTCCPRCEGNGNLYADGKGHYMHENAPTINCGNCGGSGRLQPANAQDIAADAIAEAEKE